MSYRNDPRWITARFASTCKCGDPIRKGSRIYFYPLSKVTLCEQCGEPAAREFAAMAADESAF